MSSYKYTKENLTKAVENSFSVAEVCRKLGIRPVGGNYKTINFYIKKYEIDKSHFTGQGWNSGNQYRNFNSKRDLSEILVENSTFKTSNHLKKRLIDEGVKEAKCEFCKNTEWLGKPIKLELHHINGNNMDNRLENLQLLCPNCHSYTDTFRKGKSALSERREVEYRKFKEDLHCNDDVNLEPSSDNEKSQACAETRHGKPKSKLKKNTCICMNCGKEFVGKNRKYCSTECYREAIRVDVPNVFELLEKFKELKSYVQVGKFYNVSDNAVRKWCKYYKIIDMVKE